MINEGNLLEGGTLTDIIGLISIYTDISKVCGYIFRIKEGTVEK